MEKDFIGWHALKEQLHDRQEVPTFQEREIWWCSIGANIGYEQDGKHVAYHRPVLITRKFSRHLFLGVPLTTKIKTIPHYHRFTFKEREQCALLMQVRAWSAKRLQRRLGKLPEQEFCLIREALRAMF